MSVYTPHIRAFRELGHSILTAAEDQTLDERSRETLVALAVALNEAADALEAGERGLAATVAHKQDEVVYDRKSRCLKPPPHSSSR